MCCAENGDGSWPVDGGSMKFKKSYVACDPAIQLPEVTEIEECITGIPWGRPTQAVYNSDFEREFKSRGWQRQPQLFAAKKGDFKKNGVLVEVQFGNSATVFRDLYKFHYCYTHGDIDLGVLILPTSPKEFFPHRPKSVHNMADFDFADRHFKELVLSIPVLLIGLQSEPGDYVVEFDDDMRPLRLLPFVEEGVPRQRSSSGNADFVE
jgi:hypothetical protein